MGTRTIGIYGDIADVFVQGVVSGVIQYCTDKGGFRVRDFRMRNMVADLVSTVPPWKGHVDGVIVGIGSANYPTETIADWISSGGAPAVCIGNDWFDPRVPSFGGDHAAAVACAVEHLQKCGCESYLFIGFANSAGSTKRGGLFCNAFAGSGKRVVYHPLQDSLNGSFEDIAILTKDQKLMELLHELPKPIGTFVLNDAYAAGFNVFCRHLQLAVPGAVRILGTGDTSLTRMQDPQLSSVRVPREELGREMMAGLHRILDGAPPPTKPTLVGGAYVVARESTIGVRESVGSIDEVRKYIEEHACAGVTVDELVDIVGVSRRSFEHWFREQVGHTPGDEILRVRLRKAKELLTRSELSMARIAAMVGFTESGAFSRFFRNGTGTSPRDFRKTAAARN
jgi:LacI family transcriptional regulator